MSSSLLPEKPILISPSLAATIGLDEATLLSVLGDMTHYRQGQNNNGYIWYQVPVEQLQSMTPFWNAADLERICNSLRDKGILLLASALMQAGHNLKFAFNDRQQQATLAPQTAAPAMPTAAALSTAPQPNRASVIPANWQPDQNTLTLLSQLNIPEHFAREQVPEFVAYWRESGQPQRTWGSKFVNHIKRKWEQHRTLLARADKAQTMSDSWAPKAETLQQLANDGIPTAFIQRQLTRFRLYYQQEGSSKNAWDMTFYSWVKEDWDKQDTPFIDKRQSSPMQAQWRPEQHTFDYLRNSYGIDPDFIDECVPEFIHKWIEKNAYHSEWGNIFAQHVIEQWRFVQAGIARNPQPEIIRSNWQPSTDCVELLVQQSGVAIDFIRQQIPEFVLYWSNRGQPMHSWDNIFIRNVKHQWAKRLQMSLTQANQHAGQQNVNQSTRTKDRAVSEQLSDRSWAY